MDHAVRQTDKVAALQAALAEAIEECRRHNGNYHHVTAPDRLEAWAALLSQGRQREAKGRREKATRRRRIE